MNITINFDMDGTIADFYGVENWLDYLMNEDTYPYAAAKPRVRMCSLAKRLNNLQREGVRICIISWLSKSGSAEYNEAVTEVKKEWLRKHLPSVHFDEIIIVPYGTPKQNYCKGIDDILFDDELHNRETWGGIAYDVDDILNNLKKKNLMESILAIAEANFEWYN